MTTDLETLHLIMAKADEKLARATRDLTEGFPGDSASRAFYAAFHAVTAALATRGMSFSSHRETIGAFNREFVAGKMVPPATTRTLRKLFDDRQVADYAWKRTIDEKTATEDLAAAQAIVEACRKIVEDSSTRQS